MEHWAFFDAESGDELARGWQGYESQARQIAQRKANQIGKPVEFISEELIRYDPCDEDAEPVNGEVVEPETRLAPRKPKG
jgi:hypothetical protein